MKKRLIIISLLFMIFPVYAAPADCGAFSEILNPLAHLIMIAAPILLIVMGSIDLLRVVSAGDEKDMRKMWSNLLKRLIICIIVIILPIIINMIIGWTTFEDLSACL